MTRIDRQLVAYACLASLATSGCSRVPSPLTPSATGPVGTPSRGVLRGGALLPKEGPGYRWFSPVGKHWGIPRFVRALAGAAGEVARARPAGPPLLIGDLSARAGGAIPNHASHRTGRDVDVLFYVASLDGRPEPSPGFVKFGADGLAFAGPDAGGPRYLRLDVERDWLFVRALVTSPEANVQWIFVSAPIEGLLVEWARARGESDEVIVRAQSVMRQPTDSLPHDDHFHVRTACLPDEAVAGCEGGGPYWPWLPQLPHADAGALDAAIALEASDDPPAASVASW